MTREWRIFLTALGIVVIPGGIYAGITAHFLTKICYKLWGFKIVDIGKKDIKFNLVIMVKNPARVDLNIEGYEFDVEVNGVPVARIENNNEKVIDGQGVSYLTIPISFGYEKFIKKTNWAELVALFITGQSDKIFISLNGKFMGGIFKIPISRKVKVKMSLAEIAKNSESKTESVPCEA